MATPTGRQRSSRRALVVVAFLVVLGPGCIVDRSGDRSTDQGLADSDSTTATPSALATTTPTPTTATTSRSSSGSGTVSTSAGPTLPDRPVTAGVEAESIGNVAEQADGLNPTAAQFLAEAEPERIEQLAGGVCAVVEDATDRSGDTDLARQLGALYSQLTPIEQQGLDRSAWLESAGALLAFFCPAGVDALER
jgi:hypothetical protein